jgi:hypothetical protein|tara:strand:- start:2256 stop:2612 length:357 start_codon:yes stop_codon:yes gene_type:complete
MRDLLEKLDSISTPVNEQASVNINMNAETPNEVAELMQIMSNAGLSPSIVPTATTDDPKIPGKDDVEGDQDLNAGLLGGAAGSYIGSTLGAPLGPIGSIGGGILGGIAGDAITGDGIV